ncbi:hypothetical protein JIQ42_06077 [Leishmania sp. Namibia]|uniref:hypothetical protein n=1 Tax=Leishmania sp. Namibia TaxID=2802991 RepID=UPI001B40F05E|nr:hypothetical protein JIQ42_06077 [Leishmania sp. Namibia]
MHYFERSRGTRPGAAKVVPVPDAPAKVGHGGSLTRGKRDRRRAQRSLVLACVFAAGTVVGWLLYSVAHGIITESYDAERSMPPPPRSEGVQSTRKPPTITPPLPSATVLSTKAPETITTASFTTGERPKRPRKYVREGSNYSEEGRYLPEEPHLLPGLQIERRTFTPAELLARFGDTDIIYSFVNGSEANQQYRRLVRNACITPILEVESDTYRFRQHPSTTANLSNTAHPSANAANGVPVEGKPNRKEGRLPWGNTPLPSYLFRAASTKTSPFYHLSCAPSRLRPVLRPNAAVRDLLQRVKAAARTGVGIRDRETDELRHSLRSVEQHVPWHRGRVVMVSPGHHPTWVDGAKNFLAGMCGGARVQALRTSGTHLRVTTVHQDAVMPYGMRLTVDSHVIEQHLWRVRNVTPVHVYMNDDYFVNRDVAITDLFNEYGGTIVRTERGVIGAGAVAGGGGTWAKGVLHTQQFNTHELDVLREDYLPDALVAMWEGLRRVHGRADAAALAPISVPPLNEAVDVAHHYEPEPLPNESLTPRRPRRYATHAPFVYCTNMFRFFETRYEREFAGTALRHRSRKARDLFIPFVYNAFIMARPWQASPKFLAYLLELHRSRREARIDAMPPTKIVLDNVDGCGPASLRGGFHASQCVFGKFVTT